MVWPFKRGEKKEKRSSPLRIFVWAVIISGTVAALQAAMPLEDILRGGRNALRIKPADGSIMLVAIDDQSVREMGSVNYSRSNDARAIDNLLKAGAKRVYYDKAFADPIDKTGDDQFARLIASHRDQVFLGAFRMPNQQTGQDELVLPTKPFSEVAQVRSLIGKVAPFGLSAELAYGVNINGSFVPGVAADIAGSSRRAEEFFRPDWSIDIKSIPVLTFADALTGKFDPRSVAGKDVVVGKTMLLSNDWLKIPGQGWFPAVYAHILGAQTLRSGTPRDIGAFPPLAIAIVLSGLFLRSKRKREYLSVLSVAVVAGVAVPFVLDALYVTADFIPAYLMFGIAAIRATTQRNLQEARRRNAGTLMPNLSALREERLAAVQPIIAMRLRNYAAINASFAEPVEDELVSEVARRLDLPGHRNTYYQAEDVLYWLAPKLSEIELRGHVEGLSRLIESHFILRDRKIDVQMAFGIDMDLSRPVANRIGRALLAADNAASNHQLVMFNTTGNDEDSAWELSLMSELDAAIDQGHIWIAFQPQFNLHDNRMFGAEALVRWQHPTRGAISPEAFILPAEAHNRISRLTFHVLEQATQSAVALVARNPFFRLSVNISANLLQQEHLPFKISQVLARSGFPASNLTLEVTESAPFKEHDLVRRNLAGIADLGIDLSIDDYGTGNATLDYLRSVPCQEIKIDRRFVTNLAENASDTMLVESTIVLAHALGRRVIAEGIESPQTLNLLRELGCDIVQGYFLAKPMQLHVLNQLLDSEANIAAA